MGSLLLSLKEKDERGYAKGQKVERRTPFILLLLLSLLLMLVNGMQKTLVAVAVGLLVSLKTVLMIKE